MREPSAEAPAGELTGLGTAATERIEALATRYRTRFESRCSRSTALQSYEYLDLLDQAFAAWEYRPAAGLEVHDVGCASFGYAAALVALLQPAALTAVEIDGYRRLRGGVNRHERALGLIADLPGVEFLVADYANLRRPAGIITAFFPFVSRAPVLAWRLPLSVLAPARLFGRIAVNLGGSGTLLMVNHSADEAELAAGYAAAAGLVREAQFTPTSTLAPRPRSPLVSRWRAGARPGQG